MIRTTRNQYATYDRSYPAEIFNRMIFFNHNSKAKKLGYKFQIRAIHESGIDNRHYSGAGNRNSDSRNNFIGVQLHHLRRNRDLKILAIYVDGTATYYPNELRYSTAWYIAEKVTELVMEHYAVREQREDGQLLLVRRPCNTEFNRHNQNNIGDILVQKYNTGRT